MAIIIDNNHLTFVARELVDEFNVHTFLNWYEGVNVNFQQNKHPMTSSDKNIFFIGSKNNIRVVKLPELSIYNEVQLQKFILYDHGFFREPIIKLLKNDFNIDFWNEYLNYCHKDKNKVNHVNAYKLLSHSMNDWEFTEKHTNKIKEIIEHVIDNINNGKNKFFTEILQYIIFTVDNKDSFENDWIVKNLNEIFRLDNGGSSKQFNFYLDKITKRFHELDFSKIQANPEFKKILKGKIPLTKITSCYPFFWEIDIPRYCLTNKTVTQLLQTNCIAGLTLIEKFLKTEYDVLSVNFKREKNVYSLSVLHENDKLNSKLDILLESILTKTANNLMVNESEFEKDIVYINLNDTLKDNKIKDKRTKV